MPYQLRVTCALTASEQPILAPQVIVFPESVSPDELHQAGAAYPEALLVGAILVTLRLLVFLAKQTRRSGPQTSSAHSRCAANGSPRSCVARAPRHAYRQEPTT